MIEHYVRRHHIVGDHDASSSLSHMPLSKYGTLDPGTGRWLPEPASKHLEILDRNVGPGLPHEDAHPTGIRNNAQVVGAHTLLGFDLEDGNGHSLAEFSGMSTNQCQKALPVEKAAKDHSHNGAGATRRISRLNLRSSCSATSNEDPIQRRESSPATGSWAKKPG